MGEAVLKVTDESDLHRRRDVYKAARVAEDDDIRRRSQDKE